MWESKFEQFESAAWRDMDPALVERQAALYCLASGRGYGKGLHTVEEIRRMYNATPVPISTLDLGRMGTGTLIVEPPTELPKKPCAYPDTVVEWYGERKIRTKMKYPDLIIKGLNPDNMNVLTSRTLTSKESPWVPKGTLIEWSGTPLPQTKDKE